MNIIVIWVKEKWKEWWPLILLIPFVSLVAGGIIGGWFITSYAVVVVYYVAHKRFRIADKQLEIVTKRENLDRYLEGVKLLIREDEMSQLAGVRGLTVLLASDADEELTAKEARISLETFLKENWEGFEVEHADTLESMAKQLRRYQRVRDDIIKALGGIYRKEEDNLDLSFLNLMEAKLDRVNLSGAEFFKANLSKAILNGTNLSRANLSRANLSGADLISANLSDVNLSKADLSGAGLSHANLSGANLSGANLSGANLSHVDFQGVIGLKQIGSYKGIWAYRGIEPKGLSGKLMEEVQSNLKNR